MDELEITKSKSGDLKLDQPAPAESQSILRSPLLDFELSDCPISNSPPLLSGKTLCPKPPEGGGPLREGALS
jgi:hypothetical protein